MKKSSSEAMISQFSDQLETLEKKLGLLLNEIRNCYSDEAVFLSQAPMLELRTKFLYQSVLGLQQEMISVQQKISGVSLAVLSQQMILAENQRGNLERLSESLTEMRKAAGTTRETEKLILLYRLKDCLEAFDNQSPES